MGQKFVYTITVGPIEMHAGDMGPAEERRMAREMKGDLDKLIRGYWTVGKRSKYISTSMVRIED